MSEDFFIKIYLSLYLLGFEKGYSRFACERELETEQNCNIMTPTLMAVSVVSFSLSRAAQPEAQGPNLLGGGFLYCILSATSLDPKSSGAPRAPSAWRGFPYHTSSLTPTVWLLVLTELYNSSTSTQWPTQSLEWHVWLSSSGNNCHAVHRSLSSGASVYECNMVFFFALSHFISQIPHTRFLSVTGHWDVSLPTGASLWNGTFARVEGQNTTQLQVHNVLTDDRKIRTAQIIDEIYYLLISCRLFP